MGFKQNTITDEEHKQRMDLVIPLLEARQLNTQTINEMFFLYNDRLQPRETGTKCGGCQTRVFKRLKEYYNGNS